MSAWRDYRAYGFSQGAGKSWMGVRYFAATALGLLLLIFGAINGNGGQAATGGLLLAVINVVFVADYITFVALRRRERGRSS